MATFKKDNIVCTVSELKDNKRLVRVSSLKNDAYFPRETSIVTDYPIEFIQDLFELKGIYLSDELHRETVSIPHRLGSILKAHDITTGDKDLSIIDFGSGCSSSTLAIASNFKYCKITCVELEKDSIELAKKRITHHQLDNIEFICPDNPNELPDTVKKNTYDICVLSAVVEHLMPEERKRLLPKLWDLIKPGGHVLIYETPHRWFPMEVHTTSLPFMNYLPLMIAAPMGIIMTKKNRERGGTDAMLRAGFRGTSLSEMKSYFGSKANLLKPNKKYAEDIIDLWYQSDYHKSKKKDLTYKVCKFIKKFIGLEITPWVTYVFRK